MQRNILIPALIFSFARFAIASLVAKWKIPADDAMIEELVNWSVTIAVGVILTIWSVLWDKKRASEGKPLVPTIGGSGAAMLVLCLMVLTMLAGCANKPGTALAVNEATPISFADPSTTHSTAVLGQQTTTTTGPLSVETSKLDNEGLYETNAGGAAKQRGAFTIGRLKGMLSGSSDLDIAGIEMTFGAEGDVVSLKIDRIGTDNSAVQRAVNEGVVALVSQWSKSSDNEREVLVKQLDTQAKMGDVAASLALSIIKAVAGVP